MGTSRNLPRKFECRNVDEPPDIYAVGQLVAMLAAAPPEVIPGIVIGAFSALRTAELMRLRHYSGKEQAYVKHCLLAKYLPRWFTKSEVLGDSIVYVDGFSGPWKVNDPDLRDSSFGVAVETLRAAHVGLYQSHGRNVPIEMILVEANKQAFTKLEEFAAKKPSSGFRMHACTFWRIRPTDSEY